MDIVQIKDDPKNGLYVENVTEEYVTNYDDVTQILVKVGIENQFCVLEHFVIILVHALFV